MLRQIRSSDINQLESRLNAYHAEVNALEIKITKHQDGTIQMPSAEEEKAKLDNRRMRLNDITRRLIPDTIHNIAEVVQNLPRGPMISLSQGRDK